MREAGGSARGPSGPVRELLDEETWERISAAVAERAGARCEICGGRGPRHRPVECHELWRYDDRVRVQALVRIVALCPDCHTVQHMGFANLHGGGTQARAHLARINGWSLARTDAHIADAFRLWAQRNHQPWILDLEGLRPYLAAAEYARRATRAYSAAARYGRSGSVIRGSRGASGYGKDAATSTTSSTRSAGSAPASPQTPDQPPPTSEDDHPSTQTATE